MRCRVQNVDEDQWAHGLLFQVYVHGLAQGILRPVVVIAEVPLGLRDVRYGDWDVDVFRAALDGVYGREAAIEVIKKCYDRYVEAYCR